MFAALDALGVEGTGPDAALVLRDGRAHAILTRTELLSALTPGHSLA